VISSAFKKKFQAMACPTAIPSINSPAAVIHLRYGRSARQPTDATTTTTRSWVSRPGRGPVNRLFRKKKVRFSWFFFEGLNHPIFPNLSAAVTHSPAGIGENFGGDGSSSKTDRPVSSTAVDGTQWCVVWTGDRKVRLSGFQDNFKI
jgi:hypothetical protein